jgi:serine phosphatase RsbU (regulator of sigma subunit)
VPNMQGQASNSEQASDTQGETRPTEGRRGAPSRPAGITVLVLLIGLAITVAATGTAVLLNTRSEHRLLRIQTLQAGEVLTAAVPNTQTPLATSLQIAAATNGNAEKFNQFMEPYVATGGQFTSATLLGQNATGFHVIATVGSAPNHSRVTQTIIHRALLSQTFVVTGIVGSKHPHIGYAYALTSSHPQYLVYAEHAIPPDKKSSVASNAAFADLNYAIYLGPRANPKGLLTTSFKHLPPTGHTSSVTVPFGDSKLTLVAAASGQLGGDLSEYLPWIFGIIGTALTITAAWMAQRLVRRRRAAERDADQIGRLYSRLEELYGEQRTIAETLQRALLPQVSPNIAGLETAVRYVPGAKGVDIGGDWYSVVAIDDDRFGFVVGDVSGRGISAATIMAALRYTIRTLVLEGNSPASVLDKCSKYLDVIVDGHFATVMVGIGDMRNHQVTLSNAGHLNPLLINGERVDYMETNVGVPLGVGGQRYQSVTFSSPPNSTLIAFTDGLIERRGEGIDVGLDRLKESATAASRQPLEEMLNAIISTLTNDASEDDVAVLALRWLN